MMYKRYSHKCYMYELCVALSYVMMAPLGCVVQRHVGAEL